MAISDLPILNMLRTRMQWHQERQRLLAENVANADTPDFRPRDLAPPEFDRALPPSAAVALARTDAAHLGSAGAAGSGQFKLQRSARYEVRPAGNAVNLEDEMQKIASNQMDYQAATTLYSRSLGLLKLAVSKR
jgi:flagellar basal-body rod protein FlgB